MRTKTVNDIIFTQWLHNKFSGSGSASAEFSEVLVNLIICNDLDVDIVDLDHMYDDILNFLRLNAPTFELVEFFRKAWLEYKDFMGPLEQRLESIPFSAGSRSDEYHNSQDVDYRQLRE